MRGLFPRLIFAFALTSRSLISAAEIPQPANVEEDVLGIQKPQPAPLNAGAAAGATNSEDLSDASTTFNGISVPPMRELKGDSFNEETKDGYWYDFSISSSFGLLLQNP